MDGLENTIKKQNLGRKLAIIIPILGFAASVFSISSIYMASNNSYLKALELKWMGQQEKSIEYTKKAERLEETAKKYNFLDDIFRKD